MLWPWCDAPLFTTDPMRWHFCHFTSDPLVWPECAEPYPTKDYTWDPDIWPECGGLTEDPLVWPSCAGLVYTLDTDLWPWCNPAWTANRTSLVSL